MKKMINGREVTVKHIMKTEKSEIALTVTR